MAEAQKSNSRFAEANFLPTHIISSLKNEQYERPNFRNRARKSTFIVDPDWLFFPCLSVVHLRLFWRTIGSGDVSLVYWLSKLFVWFPIMLCFDEVWFMPSSLNLFDYQYTFLKGMGLKKKKKSLRALTLTNLSD